MGRTDIPLDKAELLSVLLEAILYGFSLLMFGGTIWTLVFQRCTERVNRRMLATACALLLISTVHIVIDIIRVMEGLILYRDSYPGGPVAYFSDPWQWTFISKNITLSLQTLIGDGVILYRCYVAWQSKLVMVLPVLFWIVIAVIGFMNPFITITISQKVMPIYSTTLVSNVITTGLLVYRLWYIDHKAARREHRPSQLRPILHIVVDAGVFYTVTLFSALICYLCNSNGEFVILDMVTPIISISFFMVITRVGMLRAKQAKQTFPLAHSSNRSRNLGFNNEQRSTMQVHIVTSTERKMDDMTPIGSDNSQSDIKFDGM